VGGAGRLFREDRVLFPRESDRKTERESKEEAERKERRKRGDDGVLERVR
jgi:hypothetical protein